MRFRRALAVLSGSVETCCGYDPHLSAFAARCAPRAARRGAPTQSQTGPSWMASRLAIETTWARSASVRARSGSGGLEDRSAASYTSLAGSWLRESNPFGAPYQGAPRPTATSGVESLGNAPRRSACKAEQQPSASDPGAGPLGIEPSSEVLEASLRPSLRPTAPRMGFDPISSARQADVHAS